MDRQDSLPENWAGYLRWLLATLIVAVTAVGAANVMVDPLAIFNSPRIEGVNVRKPYLDHHRELARWQRARRFCGNAAIFGNSRAEIGFDPETPSFAGRGLLAFNHAVPGTSVSLSLRQLRWLSAAGCTPNTFIVGVEFFDFLDGGQRRESLPTNEPAPRIDAVVVAETVFSITALRDSLGTLFLQNARYPAIAGERGFNPLHHYLPDVERSGQYVFFRQRAEENARNWARRSPSLKPPDGGPSDNEAALDALLDEAARPGRAVHLVIYPYHAQVRLMLERLGLAETFAQWKAMVVELAERHAERGATVAVWDFSGLSPETQEAIPARGDRKTHLRYYWEGGHFKKALGDRVIAAMLNGEPGFGVRLTRRNLDRWLAEDRAAVRALIDKPSALLADVDEIVAATVGARRR